MPRSATLLSTAERRRIPMGSALVNLDNPLWSPVADTDIINVGFREPGVQRNGPSTNCCPDAKGAAETTLASSNASHSFGQAASFAAAVWNAWTRTLFAVAVPRFETLTNAKFVCPIA